MTIILVVGWNDYTTIWGSDGVIKAILYLGYGIGNTHKAYSNLGFKSI